VEPTIGRIVLYKLTSQDAIEINRRRTTGSLIAERIKKNTPDTSAWPLGAQAHIGNEVKEDDVFPMIVTRVWSASCVNGQAFLDGNDCLWVTSATEGSDGHQWQWPPRVG
jgi:hypothetical protein